MAATTVRRALAAMAARVAERLHEINELDAVIGDGDHGFAVHRGFQAVVQAVEQMPPETSVSGLLKQTGMTLLSAMGGSAGPLYATGCLELARGLADHATPTVADWAAASRRALEGICRRGNSQPGQKTVLDALFPAVEALEAAAARGLPAGQAVRAALAAARAGRDATAQMVAARGRASYLGERSLGHPDAGAAMFCVLLEAILESVEPGQNG